MNLYLCADGTYAGTQADAKAKGRGWKAEEVPTDKAGLLDYLNRNRHISCECHGAGPDAIRKLAEGQEREPLPPLMMVDPSGKQPPVEIERREVAECSKCKWDLRSRQRYADRIERDLTIEGVEQWIDKCEPNYIGKLVSAVTCRLTELARGIG